eukprot:Em0007g534a
MAGMEKRETKETKEVLEHQDSLDMMAKMVRKENREHPVLLAALVPMVLMESLARKERRVYLVPREPLESWTTRHYHIFYDRACIGSELYIKWGSRNCLNGEINLFVGHIVTSNNLKDVDGDYICLPNEHNAYSTRIQNAKLRLEDVNDANGKNIPCAACRVVRDRSIIFTFTDTTTCHQKWSVEYVGFLAANPENPGENICVDTATSNGLLNNPSKDLAVIATGSYSAYDAYKQQDAVSWRCVLYLSEIA